MEFGGPFFLETKIKKRETKQINTPFLKDITHDLHILITPFGIFKLFYILFPICSCLFLERYTHAFKDEHFSGRE